MKDESILGKPVITTAQLDESTVTTVYESTYKPNPMHAGFWPPELKDDDSASLEPMGEEQRFNIGSDMDDVGAEAQRCKKCGGVEFHVGLGSWYTAIRCVKCKWEMCVHAG